jgi:protein-arginine kinase activator protein McsA
MRETTRCREYREGRIGSYHSYLCRKCGRRFRVFLSTGNTLTIASRICFICYPTHQPVVEPIIKVRRNDHARSKVQF